MSAIPVDPGQLNLLSSVRREISMGQAAIAVFCGWEGNRRSDITSAMRHRLSDL